MNVELTLTIIQRQRNRIPNIHDVYHDDQEIMISSLNQKDAPLGQQEPNMKECSTQRTSHRQNRGKALALMNGQPQRRRRELNLSESIAQYAVLGKMHELPFAQAT